MKLSEIYEQISAEINELDFQKPSLGFLTKQSSHNINVYKENFLSGAIERLELAYPGVKSYLEGHNFNFFVRLYLKEESITSFNINNFIKGFVNFLISKFDIHENELLIFLARLDHMWHFGENDQSETLFPKGLLYYRQALIEKIDTTNTLDLEKRCIITVIETDTGLALKEKSVSKGATYKLYDGNLPHKKGAWKKVLKSCSLF
jgi:hypothetical protein